MSGPVVTSMGDITKVTHGVRDTLATHLPVVPGGAKVNVVDFAVGALATADNARGGLGHAAHLLTHLQAVVGGHGILAGSRSRCPTGH